VTERGPVVHRRQERSVRIRSANPLSPHLTVQPFDRPIRPFPVAVRESAKQHTCLPPCPSGFRLSRVQWNGGVALLSWTLTNGGQPEADPTKSTCCLPLFVFPFLVACVCRLSCR
jgi:hypothetical protein